MYREWLYEMKDHTFVIKSDEKKIYKNILKYVHYVKEIWTIE